MKKFEKAELQIVYFECEDIITTSTDHDNGFIDGGDLMRMLKDFKESIPDSLLLK